MELNRLVKCTHNIIVTCLVIVFVFTAISKFNFIYSGGNLKCLWIPLVESMTAITLVIPRTRHKAIFMATVILSVWTTCSGYRLLTGRELPFHCGGIHESIHPTEQFYLSALLLLLGCMGITLFLISSYHDSRSSRIPV